MSIWGRVKDWARKAFNRTPSGWVKPDDYISGQPYSYAGVFVTPDIALQVSTVWACVNVIGNAIASSPWEVYQRLRDGDRELLPMHPLVWLLNTRPNPDMTAMAFHQAMVAQALLVGDAYAEIEFDSRGAVIALWPMWWEHVDCRRDQETGELIYLVRDTYRYAGMERVLQSWQVFHLKGNTVCGWIGEGIAIKGANSISLAIAQERFAATYFGNGTNVGGTLEVAGALDQRQKQELREDFEASYRGAAKSHRPLVLEGGQKYTPFTPDAQKSQMTEARQHSIEEIARYFAVPLHKIGHLLRATNNNIEHQGIEFSRETLRPWTKRLEQEADYKLFPTRGAWRFVLIDLEWASQGDFKSRMEGYAVARNMGVYSVNDVLRAEGKNTIGKEGDTRMVQGAMVDLEELGIAYVKPEAPEPTEEPAIEPDESVQDKLAGVVRLLAESVYDRAARRRSAYESQMGPNPSAGAAEKYAEFLDSQRIVLARELLPVAKSIAKTWGYSSPQPIQAVMLAEAADLFSAGATARPTDWASRIVALYRKD